MVVSSTNSKRPAPVSAFTAFCFFYLYIIRYNRTGHGCRPRVPHIGTAHDSRTRPTGARRANVPQNRLKRTKNVKKPDFTAVFTPFLKIGDNLQNPYKKPVIFVKIYYYAMKWAFFDVYMLKNIVFKHICRGF